MLQENEKNLSLKKYTTSVVLKCVDGLLQAPGREGEQTDRHTHTDRRTSELINLSSV